MRDHAGDVPLMLYNLVRAVVWNAAFMLPFALLAIPVVRRREGMAERPGGIIARQETGDDDDRRTG